MISATVSVTVRSGGMVRRLGEDGWIIGNRASLDLYRSKRHAIVYSSATQELFFKFMK